MSDLLCEIDISDIDLSDERYKIRPFPEEDITFLALSIKEAGLVTPPIVRPLNHKFIIISGFNRIRALIHNNETKIVVYKIKQDASDYQCLLKSLTSLSFKRPLTHCELIICTRRLYQFLDKKEIAKKSPALFNTQLNIRFVEDLLTIGEMPDPALELIHTGNLSLNSAKKISFFEKETIKIFLALFSKIKASNNKQLEIILHIMEIAARDAVKPESFFTNQEIQSILFDENKEPGLKTNLLRTWLFEQRFPTVFKTRQMVQEKIAAIKFCNNIKFKPPENFDDQHYSITFTAKNYDEFKTNTHYLNSALENKALKEIFNQ